MLGIVFIYFLGRSYYRLAEEYKKSKWLWAVLGVVFYYGINFLVGLVLAFTAYNWAVQNDILLMVIGIGLGLGGSIGIYHLLKYNWSKQPVVSESNSDILDQ